MNKKVNFLGQHNYFEYGLIDRKLGVLQSVRNFLRFLYYNTVADKYRVPEQEIGQKKYSVCICGIFKNEEPYLKEWLEHHLKIGVEHFYLYNNNSTDNYSEILKPYIERGLVTLTDWPKNQAQLEAYEECIREYSVDTNWLGFIDIDEFIMLREDIPDIADVLKNFSGRGSVVLYWRVFGSSGFKKRDVNGSVVKDFQSCWSKYRINGKCFFNTAYMFRRENQRNGSFHHRIWGEYKGKALPPVNCYDHFSFRTFNIADDAFPAAWINHYCIKSLNEYQERLKKGDVFFAQMRKDMAYFRYYDEKCDSDARAEYRERMEYLKNTYSPKRSRIRTAAADIYRRLTGKVCYLPEAKNSREDTDYVFPHRIAVYTCITGGYDALYEPLFKPENIDYYAVTDFDIPKESLWKRIDIRDFDAVKGLSDKEINRFFKMHPDLLFPGFEYSVYVDGNIRIITDFSEHINRLSELGFSTFRHAKRRCVYEEIDACLSQQKATATSLEQYRTHLLEMDFPENYGLAVCSVIARRHHDPQVKKIMEEWWQSYMKYVERDQVVLPEVLRKNGIGFDRITTLGGNIDTEKSFSIQKHL